MNTSYTTLSIVIPAYNEEKTLRTIVEKVQAVNTAPLKMEIIIVDNNSTDRTNEIARSIPGVTVLEEKTKGKGAALACGIKQSHGDIIIIQDADLEYEPNDFQALIKPILEKKTEMVLGVRIESRIKKSDRIKIGLLGWIGTKIITLTTNILYLNWAGEYTGGYKAFTRSAYDSVTIKTHDFDFDSEFICKLLKKGYKTVDVPIHYYPRSYAEGKKICWKHGFQILWTTIKYRFIA